MYQKGNTSAAIDNFDIFPLGSIMPWVNKPEKDSLHQEELPDGWVLCDGNVIPKGQLKLTFHLPEDPIECIFNFV